MKKRHFNAILIFALWAGGSALPAAVILNETFSDGDYTEGADPADSQWRVHTNIAATTLSGSAGNLEIGRIGANGNGFNPGAVTTFSPQSLAVGETIILSFDFNVLGGTAGADGLRFGLYNSGTTSLSSDLVGNPPGTGTTFQNDVGYSVFAPLHGTQNASLRYRAASGTNNILQISAAANTSIGTGTIGSPTSSGIASSASFSIGRVAANTYNFNVNFAGNSFAVSSYSPAASTDTFDTLTVFTIIPATATYQSLVLDNVKVEVVPEPSASACALLGLLACTRRRR